MTPFQFQFLDPVGGELPPTLQDTFTFCEQLWYSSGIYQQALQKIAAYFVTRVQVDTKDPMEKERWEAYLTDDLHINNLMVNIGRNFMAYGNVMLTPRVQITRYLVCPHCQNVAPLARWKYTFANGEFKPQRGGCPNCGYKGVLKFIDRRGGDPDAVDIRIWNPHSMNVLHNEITGHSTYYHSLSADSISRINRGDPSYIEDTPWDFVECAIQKKPMRIYNDQIFHMRDVPLAGIDSKGMGIPRCIANFRQARYTQILQRMNMVLGMEYSMPMRHISPAGTSAGSDPSMNQDLGEVSNKMQELINRWRADPAAVHFIPVPVKYQAWGGEGLDMAPSQIQNEAMMQLLIGMGIPPEFATGAFKSEKMFYPILRLMERTWSDLVSSYSAALKWIGDKVADLQSWQPVKLTMEPVTTSDDVELRAILFDLYMNGRISGGTAMDTIHLDPVKENKKIIDEQVRMQQDSDDEAMEAERALAGQGAIATPMPGEEEAAAAEGGAPAGGAPGPGSGEFAGAPGTLSNTPVRPEELQAKAEQIAAEMLPMAEAERKPKWDQLRQESPALHSLVRQELDKLRSSQGTDAARAQQQ
jgi:hypothetical protein